MISYLLRDGAPQLQVIKLVYKPHDYNYKYNYNYIHRLIDYNYIMGFIVIYYKLYYNYIYLP